MNDPHVVALIYHIEHDNSVNYEKTRSLVHKEREFRVKVKDKKVCFKLKEHYATESEARESIDAYIRLWEFDAGLRHGPDIFKLKFDRAKIEDRNPTPGEMNLRVNFNFDVPQPSITHTRALPDYPSPPSGLSIDPDDPDVQTMYDRYMHYCRGYDSLPNMSNFCLTILEGTAKTQIKKKMGKRQVAAHYYHISQKVLNKIGELASTKGGVLEARKREGVDEDLTEQERRFLEEAVKKMIYRAAEKIEIEKANDPTKNLRQITLNDLPPV